MPSQKIIWTALPNGINQASPGKRMRVSVFVSPRLDPGADPPQLGTFPDFLSWPMTVSQSLSFSVQFNGGPRVPATRISNPKQPLWTQLFTANTFVRRHQFQDYRNRNLRSFSVRNTLSYLKQVYQDIGETSATDLPKSPLADTPNGKLAELIDLLGSITERGEHQNNQKRPEDKVYEKGVTQKLSEVKVIPSDIDAATLESLGFPSKKTLDFFLLDRFYDRPENKNKYFSQTDRRQVPKTPRQPKLDFHEMIASLADYPELLRWLGLVIDLEIPLTNVPSSSIAIVPEWRPARRPQPNPWTKYILTETRFMAASKGPDILNGMLNLAGINDDHKESTTSPYELIQIDPDGAGLKLVMFAGGMNRLMEMENGTTSPRGLPYTTPDEEGLPSLHSAGIGLVKQGRAFQLSKRFQEAFQWNGAIDNDPSNQPIFFTEDLLRGYRVDILDMSDPTHWRSLCARVGTYRFKHGPPFALQPDEGYVKAGSATSKDAAASDLYLHEALFRWMGWSLCAPRPGRTIVKTNTDRTGTLSTGTDFRSNEAATDVPIEVTFKASPGSLPRLRFGHRYRMRVRTVDLAGNSEPLASEDASLATDPILYTRFDPIDPPVLLPRAIISEGESVECMVIRSNFHMAAEKYISADPRLRKHGYMAINDRHVAPPKTSQLMAEMHGQFDASFGADKTTADQDMQYNRALKEEGTFFDTKIVNTDTGNKDIAVTGLQVMTPPASVAEGESVPGRYVIHTEAKLLLPYLPDVFARGVTFRGLPGVTGALPGLEVSAVPGRSEFVVKVPFKGEWPDYEPFRIAIQDGGMDPRQPKWDAVNRVLTVFLGKGEVAKVQYSCYLDRSDLKNMGIISWLEDLLKDSPPAAFDEKRWLAASGLHWMITPFRRLTLVHAVQQPLSEPTFLELQAHKSLGQTAAELNVRIRLSAKSTSKLDIQAQWKEWVDNDDSGPKLIEGKGHVAEFKIDEQSLDDLSLQNIRHEFGDTKFRRVNYSLKGTTRFREYFPAEITQDEANLSRIGPAIPNVIVRNSSRPAAPKVRYIVPIFGWEKSRTDSGIVSKRIGEGLRVYLERPWYSSGDGELLGVVLCEPNHRLTDDNDRLKPYVTQWGKDPIFGSQDPKPSPSISDFAVPAASGPPKSVRGDEHLALAEVPDFVSVAGCEVQYDNQRKLWYCDIQMNAGNSYCPFIRLALARYQPESVRGAELSRVILTDFVQLMPDRRVDVRFSNEKKVLTITAYGISPKETGVTKGIEADTTPHPPLPPGSPPKPDGRNTVEVSVEMRNPAINSDLGWIAASGVTVQERKLPVGGPAGPRVPDGPILAGPRPIQPVEFIGPKLWNGTVTLPEPLGANKYRLVLKEFEYYYEDMPTQPTEKRIAKRLVYADILEM